MTGVGIVFADAHLPHVRALVLLVAGHRALDRGHRDDVATSTLLICLQLERRVTEASEEDRQAPRLPRLYVGERHCVVEVLAEGAEMSVDEAGVGAGTGAGVVAKLGD